MSQWRWQKWNIVWATFAFLIVVAAIIAWLQGVNEQSVRMMTRSTARLSFGLFSLAFVASSAHALFRHAWSAWLLANRRYLGLSFALSHFVHLLCLISLAIWFPHPFLEQLQWGRQLPAAIAYVFLFAMAATSFAAPRRWLGEKNWKRLHTTGSYVIWVVFAAAYVLGAFKQTHYIPFAIVAVMTLVMRLLSKSIWQTSRP